MDTLDDSLNQIFERALATHPIMVTLNAPPYGYAWPGESAGNYRDQIKHVQDQVVVLSLAEAATSLAARQWDLALDGLIDDAQLGTNMARYRYKDQPDKLFLFDSLGYRSTGRDGRYTQALGFQAAWQNVEPAWVFKQNLTLANYSARREAVVTLLQVAHFNAVAAERHQRATLHAWADELNQVSVQWYAVVTSNFAEHTVPGQLIRTIPTTYNPSRPPGQLEFTAHMSTAPNSVHLLWRAPRGEHFTVLALAPGAVEYEVILNGVTDKEWIGLGLAAGAWKFKAYATNAYGTGAESAVVQVSIANALAA
jgi:hypothetical protein